MEVTSLPSELLVKIVELLRKNDLKNVILTNRAFFKAYRVLVPITPPRVVARQSTPRLRFEHHGRRRGCGGEIHLICPNEKNKCKRAGQVIREFHNMEEYDQEYQIDRYVHYDTWGFECGECKLLGHPVDTDPEFEMNRCDVWIRRGDGSPGWMIGYTVVGVHGYSINKSYEKCAIRKRMTIAVFRSDGTPDNLAAYIVTRFRFVAAICRSRNFAERLSVYAQYAPLLCDMPAKPPVASAAALAAC